MRAAPHGREGTTLMAWCGLAERERLSARQKWPPKSTRRVAKPLDARGCHVHACAHHSSHAAGRGCVDGRPRRGADLSTLSASTEGGDSGGPPGRGGPQQPRPLLRALSQALQHVRGADGAPVRCGTLSSPSHSHASNQCRLTRRATPPGAKASRNCGPEFKQGGCRSCLGFFTSPEALESHSGGCLFRHTSVRWAPPPCRLPQRGS
jgi:hypothetical protein